MSFSSSKYWDDRYKNNGNSGTGSYGQLAEYKADIINKFVSDKKINSIIEFGCGDGNQLSLLKVPLYTGYDVSFSIIEKLKKVYSDSAHKKFYHMSDYDKNLKADLTLSLDVLYHLIENNVYKEYMQKLFDASDKYVIIYSCHRNDIVKDLHIKYRTFLSWILHNKQEWKLINVIENAYPYNRENPSATSWSDFYIFEKVNE